MGVIGRKPIQPRAKQFIDDKMARNGLSVENPSPPHFVLTRQGS